MADARHFCPDCGSIDLIIEDSKLVVAGTRKCECPNCGWKGPISETLGAATTQQFWDIKRVGAVMLRTIGIHAAGPLVQALEFIGILPRKIAEKKLDGDSESQTAHAIHAVKHNRAVQRARDAVMQRIVEAALTAAFEEGERQHRIFVVENDADLHPIFNEEPKDRVFGGNVIPIGKGNREKKGKKRR